MNELTAQTPPPATDIAVIMNTQLMLDAAARGDLNEAEHYGLRIPQAHCPVFHHFGPGFCIREMHAPKGTFLIGHAHKQPMANMLIKGRMLVCSEGRWSMMEAPLFFVGSVGRKAAVVLEDSIWQNILVTDLTDPTKVEEVFIEHSDEWTAFHDMKGE
jgi:hypothetical protein